MCRLNTNKSVALDAFCHSTQMALLGSSGTKKTSNLTRSQFTGALAVASQAAARWQRAWVVKAGLTAPWSANAPQTPHNTISPTLAGEWLISPPTPSTLLNKWTETTIIKNKTQSEECLRMPAGRWVLLLMDQSVDEWLGPCWPSSCREKLRTHLRTPLWCAGSHRGPCGRRWPGAHRGLRRRRRPCGSCRSEPCPRWSPSAPPPGPAQGSPGAAGEQGSTPCYYGLLMQGVSESTLVLRK